MGVLMPTAITPGALSRARRLRHAMTEGERRLWQELRQFRRWYGIHVRRQVPIGPYIADFAVHDRRLVIEVDGQHHFEPRGLANDIRRDKWLRSQGYRVLRLNTGELADAFDSCVEQILDALGLMAEHRDAHGPTRSTAATIRPATEADLPACAAIINDYIDATAWLPRVKSRDEIAGFFNPALLESRAVLVAEADGGDVVAYMSVSDGWVYALYLADEFRGRGIGKALLDRAKALDPGGLELTMFEPNPARSFYAREGFFELSERRNDDTEEGVPVLTLRWEPAR